MTQKQIDDLNKAIVKDSVLDIFVETNPELHQEIMLWWDFWDYRVVGPCSVDDTLDVAILYKNRNGNSRRVHIGYRSDGGLYAEESR